MEDKTNILEELTSAVDEAMDDYFNGETSMGNPNLRWQTINEYSAETGKRFRMTKQQKARDLSREDAFIEFSTAAQVQPNAETAPSS